MLYFSKLRIIFISFITLTFVIIAFNNILDSKNNFFDKKLNLGLDLQGGSYLLLEIDNKPVVQQKLQNLTTTIRSYFKENNINIFDISIEEESIYFKVDDLNKEKVISTFKDEESEINPYYPRFKSHQLDITDENNRLKLSFSRVNLFVFKLIFALSELFLL